MSRIVLLLVCFMACAADEADADRGGSPHCATKVVSGCFSPKGGCLIMLHDMIVNAKERILFEDYYFTDTRLADALINAKASGRVVEGILDRSQLTLKTSVLPRLGMGGVPVHVDRQHSIFHNKIMIIDKVVCTGSYNLTRSADTSNAENVICVADMDALKSYEENYNLHLAHSDPYLPPVSKTIDVDGGVPE